MQNIRHSAQLATGLLIVILLAYSAYTALSSVKWDGKDADFGLSPDGKTIVFTGAGKGGTDLYLMDLKTSRVRALTHSSEMEGSPQFSPDGKQIVYTSNGKHSRHIFVMSVDGVNRQQLTSDEAAWDTTPGFTPDGTQIVFARATKYSPDAFGGMIWSDYDIYIMDKDGSHLRRLTNKQYFQAVSPKMAPRCQTVIYSGVLPSDGSTHGDPANPGFEVFQVDAAHPNEPVALTHSGLAVDPAFSSRGNKIYFLCYVDPSVTGSGYEVWVMDNDGQHSHQLTHANSILGGTAVSPDEKHLLVLSDKTQRDKNDLEEIRLSDGHLRQIADSSLFDDPLHWTPGKSK